jgi:hypothetical protein
MVGIQIKQHIISFSEELQYDDSAAEILDHRFTVTERLQTADDHHKIEPKLFGERELSQISLIPGPFQFGSLELAPLLM